MIYDAREHGFEIHVTDVDRNEIKASVQCYKCHPLERRGSRSTV